VCVCAASQPFSQPASQPVPLIYIYIYIYIYTASQPTNQPISQPYITGWLAGWLTGWLAAWLAGWVYKKITQFNEKTYASLLLASPVPVQYQSSTSPASVQPQVLSAASTSSSVPSGALVQLQEVQCTLKSLGAASRTSLNASSKA
jgi:hypothetical protein